MLKVICWVQVKLPNSKEREGLENVVLVASQLGHAVRPIKAALSSLGVV